jgi:hypothetical protein
MQVKDALQMFQDLVGYSFPYYHCWLILRRERKWCDWLASLAVKDKPNNASFGGLPNSDEEAMPNWPRQVLKNGQWGETGPRN